MSGFKDLLDQAYTVAQSAYHRVTTGLPIQQHEPGEILEKHLKQKDIYVEKVKRDSFVLYYSNNDKRYHVSYVMPSNKKTYSLYRTTLEDESEAVFQRYHSLELLFSCVDTEVELKALTSEMTEHVGWQAIHFAAAVGLEQYLNCIQDDPSFKMLLELPSSPEKMTPLHIALARGAEPVARRLMSHGAKSCAIDASGKSALHYAAVAATMDVGALLLENKSCMDCINLCDNDNFTALYTAVVYGNKDMVAALLGGGATAKVRCNGKSPLQEAMSNDKAVNCIALLIAACPELVTERDEKTGNTALHLARTKKSLVQLLDPAARSFDVDPKNKEGLTPLHLQIERLDINCCVKLLSYGAHPDVTDSDGNSSLHIAVKNESVLIVKTLLIFGVDTDLTNRRDQTARHLAATGIKNIDLREEMVKYLDTMQAKRCAPTVHACNSLCAHRKEPGFLVPSRHLTNSAENVLQEFNQNHAIEQVKAAKQRLKLKNDGSKPMANLLSLDGGGIRGLISIQILIAIEKALNGKIVDHFEWLAGTSTGGMLAAALAKNYSLREVQRIYFRFKDQVFQGMTRPYDSSVFEKFLQKEMTETATMYDLAPKKVMLTTVTADVMPVELKFIRNYRLPFSEEMNENMGFFDPRDWPIWKAIRCTSAAPSYFATVDGRYVDGGLVANNPSLDLIRDVHTMNSAWKYLNQPENCTEIGCVLSIGTGRIPDTPITSRLDFSIPDNIRDAFVKAMALKDLGTLLIEQVCAIEGAPVDRARSWCHQIDVPFFRFCTRLAKDVQLDTKDDQTLIEMLWETVIYLHDRRDDIMRLVTLLKYDGNNEGLVL